MSQTVVKTLALTVDGIQICKETSTVTATGNNRYTETITIGTTEEPIAVPTDIGDLGEVLVKNKDATNYVEMGYATGVYVHKLVPKVSSTIHPGTVSFYATPALSQIFLKANTAPCDVEVTFVEA